MAMVVVYALCWLPLHCVTVLGDLDPAVWKFEHIQLVWIGCHWLAMSSCCWNPIVYYWTKDTLRAGFSYALGTWCPCVRRAAAAAPSTCRVPRVVYRFTMLRASDLQVGGVSPSRLCYCRRTRRATNVLCGAQSNNDVELVQLRQLTPSASARFSVLQTSPVAQSVIRSC